MFGVTNFSAVINPPQVSPPYLYSQNFKNGTNNFLGSATKFYEVIGKRYHVLELF